MPSTSRLSRAQWWRPLDPVRSIKAKLGLLVGTAIALTALLTYLSTYVLHWPARYGLTASVAVGLVVSQVLAHGMTSPLRQMTAAARAMAAGLAPAPVATSSRDEVGDLARAFTAMAEDLRSTDAQRRELLANLAHELRTPVSAMRAQTENLVDGIRPPDAPALGELHEQVEALVELVDDLLGLARAEAGVTPLRREPVCVSPLMAAVVDQARALRPDREVTLDAPEDLVVDADPVRLRQIVTNLVDNATRHAPIGGHVLVTARLVGAGLQLDVLDDGPGIPESERERVFERFHRSPELNRTAGGGDRPGRPGRAGQAGPTGPAERAGGTDVTGGTGLGLTIARWAAGLHGGRVDVVPSDTGAHLRVTLPPG